ncbi:MAG TPA: Gfo/Idh/MocA family oxidoreductase [Bacteroidales bacterium]|jgi:predicted dehydrogenase|nr:Gfo/Idh/MocA family oxidoreductase [Bacteroidales bacterium]HQJ81064.1 Gfo/Idh/MocA family oxidoreductase [Bacteroidales bacterium]
MKLDRRHFLKLSSIAGTGIVGSGILQSCKPGSGGKAVSALDLIKEQSLAKHPQKFNMCGYAAPALDVVRTAFIGLRRGSTHLTSVSLLEGVEIKALCDLVPGVVDNAMRRIEHTGFKPDTYTGNPEAWKKMCERDDIDLVYIATPWDMHTPMAVYAMEHGKHVCIEVPAAVTMDECWQLVEVSESTQKHCMMLENCCYDFFEILTLNMARQGFFGEIVHGEGAYIHTLLDSNFSKTGYWDMWRLRENSSRQGNLYPTHGLGPICQIMDINRGDKMEYLTAAMSNDFQMNETARKLAAADDFYSEFVDRPYRGNMTTCTIKTNKGRTIMLQHDVTSPNVYSRIHKVSGTIAAALKYPLPPKISVGHQRWLNEEEFKEVEEKYTPEIIKRIGEMAKQVGGHGGMDFLMNWRLIDCLRNGLPFDQDVYDAALWSAVGPLSEWSAANRSNSIDVPDFTNGAWKTNRPVDLLLEQGGNTRVIRSNAPPRRRPQPVAEGVE